MNTSTTYHEAVTKMTRKGQVSVPVAIRKALGLKEGDKVAFALTGTGKKQATLKRAPSVTAMTFGTLASGVPMRSPQEERLAAAEAIAAEAAETDGK
jgi:AbrB family looped-hinge helix DNA binding protein